MSLTTPPAVEFIRGRRGVGRPFIPIVGTLAAEINQVPPEAFLSDPTQLTNGLQRAQRLFDLDAVCAVPDPSLVAEALGASVEWRDDAGRFVTTDSISRTDSLADPNAVPDEGRVPVVVEAADRLVTGADDDVAVFGVLPGPHTTAEALFGDRSGNDDGTVAVDDWIAPVRTATGEVARAFGQAGVDAFLLAETPAAAEDPPGSDPHRDESVVAAAVEVLEVLGNISEFFGTQLAFAPGGYPEDAVAAVAGEVALDALFLDVETPAEAPSVDDVMIGCSITDSLLASDDDEIERTVRERTASFPADAFVASGVEIPRNVHPRKLQVAQRAGEAASH